jgi:hypothetical protein
VGIGGSVIPGTWIGEVGAAVGVTVGAGRPVTRLGTVGAAGTGVLITGGMWIGIVAAAVGSAMGLVRGVGATLGAATGIVAAGIAVGGEVGSSVWTGSVVNAGSTGTARAGASDALARSSHPIKTAPVRIPTATTAATRETAGTCMYGVIASKCAISRNRSERVAARPRTNRPGASSLAACVRSVTTNEAPA